METTLVSPTFDIVVHLSHETTLADIDEEASDLILKMVKGERVLRNHASDLIVAGVKMSLIRESDWEAWETYVQPYAAHQGEGEERAISTDRGFAVPQQDDAEFANCTISRFQISRYGGAFKYGYDQLRAGRVTLDPKADNYLGKHILSIGGMRKAAALANKDDVDVSVEHSVEDDQKPIDIENVERVPEAIVVPDNNDDFLITIRAKRLTRPLLFVVYPDGSCQAVNNLSETAFDRIIKLSEQGVLKC